MECVSSLLGSDACNELISTIEHMRKQKQNTPEGVFCFVQVRGLSSNLAFVILTLTSSLIQHHVLLHREVHLQ